MFEKLKECPRLRFESQEHGKTFFCVSSFEHINFVINEKYSKKIYDNPNYYASLMIFQTYKNVFLRNVHSLG